VDLAKADLVSNVIGEKEFTKLQGFMGSVYAQKQGEDKDVALGIFEHYLPRYQNDILPTTIEGALAGIADKIDTVVGCYSVGLKPTSSKDPYALRRAVQGIIQVALDSKLELNYEKLVEKAYEIFAADKKVEVARFDGRPTIMTKVADGIKDTIARYSGFTKTEMNKCRSNAEKLSCKALWSKFIKNYS